MAQVVRIMWRPYRLLDTHRPASIYCWRLDNRDELENRGSWQSPKKNHHQGRRPRYRRCQLLAFVHLRFYMPPIEVFQNRSGSLDRNVGLLYHKKDSDHRRIHVLVCPLILNDVALLRRSHELTWPPSSVVPLIFSSSVLTYQIPSITRTIGSRPRPMARVFAASRWTPSSGVVFATELASKKPQDVWSARSE